ncbi:MAG: hypothetical protein RIR20_1115 [Pseudomonadota bacterium]
MTETLEKNNATAVVIQQLNLAYDADQDRLLLKVGLTDNSELAIWLTRRIAKSIWTWLHGTNVAEEPALQVFTMNAQGGLDNVSPQLMTPQQVNAETLINSGTPNIDFKSQYQENRTPMLDAPLLAVNCEIVEDTQTQFVLDLSARDAKRARVALSMELKIAFANMLQLATKEAGWDISLQGRHVMAPQVNSQHIVH